jgi:hypothetical protein
MSSFLWKQIPSEPVPAPVADENKEEIPEDTTSETNTDNVTLENSSTGMSKDAATATEDCCGICNSENEEKDEEDEEDEEDDDEDSDEEDSDEEDSDSTSFSVDKNVKKYIVSINDRPFYTVNNELDASKIMWNITKRLITNLNRDFAYHLRVSARGVNRLDIYSTYKFWILSYENMAHSVSYHRVYGVTIDK